MTQIIQNHSIPSNVLKSLTIISGRQRPRYAKILVVSRPKQGKTAFIGTASRRVLIRDDYTAPKNNLIYIECYPGESDTFIDMRLDFDMVQPKSKESLLNFVKELKQTKYNEYDVVALDPISFLQDIIYKDITDRTDEGGKKRTGIRGEILEGYRDFNLLYREIIEIIDELILLDKHIIVTCHGATKDHPADMLLKNKEDRRQIQSLALDGKIAHLLGAKFSIYMELEKTGSGPNINVQAKFNNIYSEIGSRFNMPESIDNPTFKNILKHAKIDNSLYEDFNWEHTSQGFKPKL